MTDKKDLILVIAPDINGSANKNKADLLFNTIKSLFPDIDIRLSVSYYHDEINLECYKDHSAAISNKRFENEWFYWKSVLGLESIPKQTLIDKVLRQDFKPTNDFIKSLMEHRITIKCYNSSDYEIDKRLVNATEISFDGGVTFNKISSYSIPERTIWCGIDYVSIDYVIFGHTKFRKYVEYV